MNNQFIQSFLYATIAARGNIPEDKAKDIAVTASIGSLVPNAPVTSLLIANKMKTQVVANENLQDEVNNRISAREVAVRMNKIMEFYSEHKEPGQHPELKFVAALGLRVAFSDSHLKLLHKHSTKGLQDIIDVSLTIPDSLPFPENSGESPGLSAQVAANPHSSAQVAAKPIHRQK